MMPRPIHLVAVLLAVFVAASGCRTGDTGDAPTSTTIESSSGSFDDHTVPSIDSIGHFDSLARSSGAQSALKFAIPDLSRPGVVWLDSSFYELHDEWYWFRLLNGQEVPGFDTAPIAVGEGPSFETIQEIYAWAGSRPRQLPLDLRFTADGDRLYSNRYYDVALRDRDKSYGVGTLVRFSTDAGDRWVIEMEYSEATTPESVAQFFDRLGEALPAEIGPHLEWVVRSPDQDATARAMADRASRYGERIVRYAELVPQGEVVVHNPGLTAGRLRLIDEPDDLHLASADDILVMDAVPDWLPPATAVLTASPQTPLAHVNLLARNRGIPNVTIGGLLDDPAIAIAARSRAFAVVSAGADGALQIALITREEFDRWDEQRTPSEIMVPAVDRGAMATVLSLTDLAERIDSEADVETLRPTIGGKSAGFLALIGAEGVTTPDSPLAVTVAPYFRHLDLVVTELEAMLSDQEFLTDARARFLLLEGADAFVEAYGNDRDLSWAEGFSTRHGAGPIRTILDADGFMNLFRDADMAADDLAEITASLRSTFGELAETQGLRFRSSSTVEDIEGFTGAGLYDSNTGFLDPLMQVDEDDHKKTVERTIKKTWASYWSFEAFEERRLENVAHRSGGMGVLVHPRFDDALEQNNGVASFTLLPDSDGNVSRVVINAQVGDVSVSNPDPDSGILPEEVVATISDNGEIAIRRLAPSTLVSDGGGVLDDRSIVELVEQLDAVAKLWRSRINADLADSQEVQTVTLDFEFKTMAPGWPAMADRQLRPSRLVIKQARSLDPGLRGIPAPMLDLPIPRDVLARAELIERVTCPGGGVAVEITTDPLRPPDLGYGVEPLIVSEASGKLDSEDCERTVLLSSPGRYLVELLVAGERLEIG